MINLQKPGRIKKILTAAVKQYKNNLCYGEDKAKAAKVYKAAIIMLLLRAFTKKEMESENYKILIRIKEDAYKVLQAGR